MARGKTLIALLDDYRAACRLSLNVAHNNQVRDTQVKELQRKQEWFWNDFDWPHLRVDRFINLQAGQRFYDLNTAVNAAGTVTNDLVIDRIQTVSVRVSGVYVPLDPGIDDGHFAAHDSELDERASPAHRWRISEGEQIEIWPIPDENADATTLEGRLRITGIRKLRNLIEDGDVADIDDQILVKSAAADYLAATGAKDAQLKLDQASRLYAKARGKLTPRRRFKMFGPDEPSQRRPIITTYRPPTT